jgi:hypothetical protein
MTDDEKFEAMMGRINNNHERLLLELRGTQTDVRSLKAEIASTRAFIDARASQTEALITQLFDRVNDRIDQTERSVEERLRKLEGGQDGAP